VIRRDETVEGIPVILLVPDQQRGAPVLWMSYLGGYAGRTVPMLERFAAAGHPAVSFDAPGHGERGSGDRWEFAESVLAAFRRRMWPLLGQTTLEALRVLDWVAGEMDASGGFLVGGDSMGGDVAIALAGIEPRVRRVVGIGSTPDWSRPGMHEIRDASRPIDQGEADAYARWFADELDPMRHLDRFRREVAIDFELGAEDHHIPEANARVFAAALAALDPPAAARVEIHLHPGLDHGVVSSSEAKDAAFEFLLADS
jgi:pimeloyl-ACP methyl ester carboxylesterase